MLTETQALASPATFISQYDTSKLIKLDEKDNRGPKWCALPKNPRNYKQVETYEVKPRLTCNAVCRVVLLLSELSPPKLRRVKRPQPAPAWMLTRCFRKANPCCGSRTMMQLSDISVPH